MENFNNLKPNCSKNVCLEKLYVKPRYENSFIFRKHLKKLSIEDRTKEIINFHNKLINKYKEQQRKSKYHYKWGKPVLASNKKNIGPFDNFDNEDSESTENDEYNENSNDKDTQLVVDQEEKIEILQEQTDQRFEIVTVTNNKNSKRKLERNENDTLNEWVDLSSKKSKSVASNDENNEDIKETDEKSNATSKKSISKITCPICNNLFFQSEIAEHASICEEYS